MCVKMGQSRRSQKRGQAGGTVIVQVGAGMPKQDRGRRMERMGHVAAALWRKNDKQIKGKEEGTGGERKGREIGKGKREGKQRRECMVKTWHLVTSASSKKKSNPNSHPPGLLGWREPSFLPSL